MLASSFFEQIYAVSETTAPRNLEKVKVAVPTRINARIQEHRVQCGVG